MLLIVRSPWRNLLPALGFLSLAMIMGGTVFRRRVDDELRQILARENLRVARLAALVLSREGRESGSTRPASAEAPSVGTAPADIDSQVIRIAHQSDARVTVIAADGTVLADSSRDAESMESHADRPEVIEALRRGVGESMRKSATLGTQMIYTAVSIEAVDPGVSPEAPAGGGSTERAPASATEAPPRERVVRVARSLANVDALLTSIDRVIWVATAVAILVSLLGCYLLIEVRISREERILKAPGAKPPGPRGNVGKSIATDRKDA
jgi:hypothetical protein